MKFHKLCRAAMTAALLISSAPAAAQQLVVVDAAPVAGAQSGTADAWMRLRYVDAAGRAVDPGSLKLVDAPDARLWADGQRVGKAPVGLVVAIDMSNSMRAGGFEATMAALDNFLAKNQGRDLAIAIVPFDCDVVPAYQIRLLPPDQVAAELSTLRRAFVHRTRRGGCTQLYGAVDEIDARLVELMQAQPERTWGVLVLSDGLNDLRAGRARAWINERSRRTSPVPIADPNEQDLAPLHTWLVRQGLAVDTADAKALLLDTYDAFAVRMNERTYLRLFIGLDPVAGVRLAQHTLGDDVIYIDATSGDVDDALSTADRELSSTFEVFAPVGATPFELNRRRWTFEIDGRTHTLSIRFFDPTVARIRPRADFSGETVPIVKRPFPIFVLVLLAAALAIVWLLVPHYLQPRDAVG